MTVCVKCCIWRRKRLSNARHKDVEIGTLYSVSLISCLKAEYPHDLPLKKVYPEYAVGIHAAACIPYTEFGIVFNYRAKPCCACSIKPHQISLFLRLSKVFLHKILWRAYKNRTFKYAKIFE